jgi:tellurite resistance protein TerC
MTHEPIGSPALWAGFLAIVGILLALDLGVFHRKAHAVGFREAAIWSCVWVAISLLFNTWIWVQFGSEAGLEFLTGYLVEKALSVDNIFVFVVIFGYFAVPAAYQHRVLFWGIFGALVLRGVFIFAGGAFLDRFHWAVYVFGGVLLFTGFRLLREQGETYEPGRNPIVRLFRRFVPTSERYHGEHFLVRENGKLLATPLLVALVAVEATDVVFAVDSIPAIFAITRDRFIVFTSNIFAILGLRALYFCLAGIIDKFHHLKVGLALVLIFIGGKMVFSELWKPPIEISLAVIATLIGGSIVTSLVVPPKHTEAPGLEPPQADA